jgi:hypothetical protein
MKWCNADKVCSSGSTLTITHIYRDWKDCFRPDKWELGSSSRVMADEQADQSYHGQLKFEGLYRGGVFKTLKIYRLFNPLGKRPYYLRTKASYVKGSSVGVCRFNISYCK